MPTISSDILFQFGASIVALLLLPLVMSWGLMFALRGIRKRLDRLISLMESGVPQDQRTVAADYVEEESIRRALRNVHGTS
jgi:hypothetical protein